MWDRSSEGTIPQIEPPPSFRGAVSYAGRSTPAGTSSDVGSTQQGPPELRFPLLRAMPFLALPP